MDTWLRGAACALLIGCSGPAASPEPLPAEEPATEEIDLRITLDMEDPVRLHCRAAMDDDPRSERLSEAEFNAYVERCVRIESGELQEPL